MLYQMAILLFFFATTVHGVSTYKLQGVVSTEADKFESLMAKIDATFTADEKLQLAAIFSANKASGTVQKQEYGYMPNGDYRDEQGDWMLDGRKKLETLEAKMKEGESCLFDIKAKVCNSECNVTYYVTDRNGSDNNQDADELFKKCGASCDTCGHPDCDEDGTAVAHWLARDGKCVNCKHQHPAPKKVEFSP